MAARLFSQAKTHDLKLSMRLMLLLLLLCLTLVLLLLLLLIILLLSVVPLLLLLWHCCFRLFVFDVGATIAVVVDNIAVVGYAIAVAIATLLLLTFFA